VFWSLLSLSPRRRLKGGSRSCSCCGRSSRRHTVELAGLGSASGRRHAPVLPVPRCEDRDHHEPCVPELDGVARDLCERSGA
jgi:hypothetical protein